MTMTTTVLDQVPVTGDPGRVNGDRQERPDPQVPERARRRTFTAQYKLEVVAAYDAAPSCGSAGRGMAIALASPVGT